MAGGHRSRARREVAGGRSRRGARRSRPGAAPSPSPASAPASVQTRPSTSREHRGAHPSDARRSRRLRPRTRGEPPRSRKSPVASGRWGVANGTRVHLPRGGRAVVQKARAALRRRDCPVTDWCHQKHAVNAVRLGGPRGSGGDQSGTRQTYDETRFEPGVDRPGPLATRRSARDAQRRIVSLSCHRGRAMGCMWKTIESASG
jgi:hypothetical protein